MLTKESLDPSIEHASESRISESRVDAKQGVGEEFM